MKTDAEKLAEEKTRLTAKVESLSSERNSLQQKYDELSKGEVRSKEEWQKRNDLLTRANQDLQRSLEEANKYGNVTN